MQYKIQEKGRIGITSIILVSMMLVPIVNAGDEPAFPEYIESITAGVSVDIVIRTDGDTQPGQDAPVGVPEDQYVMTQLPSISQYDLLELLSISRLTRVSSISEFGPVMPGVHGVNTEYPVSGSIARSVQGTSIRSDIISQAKEGR